MDNIVTIFIGNMTKEISAFITGYVEMGLDLEQLQIIKHIDAPDIFKFFNIETKPTVIFFSGGEEQVRFLHLPKLTKVEMFLMSVL